LLLLIVFLILITVSSLNASEIYVSYIIVNCKVDLYGNDEWKDAKLDMDLKEQTIVKTGYEDTMELDIDDSIVLIGKNSIVRINDLIERINEKKKFRWLKKATKYTKIMSKENNNLTSTTFAGVRGEKNKAEEVEWLGEPEEESEIDTGLPGQLIYLTKLSKRMELIPGRAK